MNRFNLKNTSQPYILQFKSIQRKLCNWKDNIYCKPKFVQNNLT